MLCGGQSGHPASPQYDDQVADWLAGPDAPAELVAGGDRAQPRRHAPAGPRVAVPAAALALALAAAVLHATWNLLDRPRPDTQAATGVALIASVVAVPAGRA